MEFNILARHFDLTPAISGYAYKKVIAVAKKYKPEIIDARVILSIDKKYIHSVEIVALASHTKYRAKGQSQDLYAAIDITLDKLERQLRKHKDKIKNHRKLGHKELYTASIDILESAGQDITERKTFAIKKMTSENAIEELRNLGYNFFVFKNTLTDLLNIVYRRDNDTYGLIELRQ